MMKNTVITVFTIFLIRYVAALPIPDVPLFGAYNSPTIAAFTSAYRPTGYDQALTLLPNYNSAYTNGYNTQYTGAQGYNTAGIPATSTLNGYNTQYTGAQGYNTAGVPATSQPYTTTQPYASPYNIDPYFGLYPGMGYSANAQPGFLFSSY